MKNQTTTRREMNMSKNERKEKQWNKLEKRYERLQRTKKLKKDAKKVARFQVAIISIIAMMVCGLGAVLVNAQQIDDDLYAYVNVETSLNLREAPSTEAEIIGRLLPGDVLLLDYYEEDGWAKVRSEYGRGYVASQYIVIISDEVMNKLRQTDESNDETEEVDGYSESENWELLNTYTVAKDVSSENRNFNMAKACEAIDGLELAPGEFFEWYGENGVGPADKEHGFKEATILVGGIPTPGYGGGVCQVATTMYNCIYGIGIDADTHYPHSKHQSYVKEGMVEATVAYGTKTFAFHNTKDYTIGFKAKVEECGENNEGGQVVVSVYKVTK